MIEFATKREVKLKSAPGTTAVLRVMTEGTRNKIRLALADTLAELRDLQNRIGAVNLPMKDGQVDESAVDQETLATLVALNDKIQFITATKINPTYVENCFMRIDGAKVDGVDIDTPEALMNNVPEAVTQEIIQLIKLDSELSVEERKNSE